MMYGDTRRNEGPDRSVFLASAVCGNISENCWMPFPQLNGWYSGECARCLPDSPHGTPYEVGDWPWHQAAPPQFSFIAQSHGFRGPSMGLWVRHWPRACQGVTRLQGRAQAGLCLDVLKLTAWGWHSDTQEPRWWGSRLAPISESFCWCLARVGCRPHWLLTLGASEWDRKIWKEASYADRSFYQRLPCFNFGMVGMAAWGPMGHGNSPGIPGCNSTDWLSSFRQVKVSQDSLAHSYE